MEEQWSHRANVFFHEPHIVALLPPCDRGWRVCVFVRTESSYMRIHDPSDGLCAAFTKPNTAKLNVR